MGAIAKLKSRGLIITTLANKTSPYDVISRCFFPVEGIPEDPVTGSAHCTIVPYWAEKLGKTELTCYQASQRGGVLQTKLEGDRVHLGGWATLYLKGEINI